MEEISLRSALMGFVASFLFWFYSLSYKVDGVLGVNKIGNIKAYFIYVFIFFAVYTLCVIVQKKHSLKAGNFNVIFSCITYIVFIVAGYSIIKDNVVLSNRMGLVIEIIAVVFSAALFCELYKKKLLNLETNRFLTILFMGFVALVWYQNVAASNIFVNSCPELGYDIEYQVHHASAYLDEIYAVWHKQPFAGGITEQYGHYALFFILPMKVLGANVNTIGKMCGLISGLTGAILTYSVIKVAKNDISKIIFGILMIGAGMFPSYAVIYWQTYPERFFIPAITIGFMLWSCNKEYKLFHYILGFIIMCLGFLWSTDSGLVCLMCYVAYISIRLLRDKGFNIKTIFKAVGLSFTNIIFVILGALGIVNIYNLICGGKPILFIKYLTMDNEGYIQKLQYPIEFWSNSYSYKMIAMFLILITTVCFILLKSQEEHFERNIVLMANATIGVGMFTYFINRPIAGSVMVNPYVYACYIGIIELFTDDVIVEKYGWLKEKAVKNLKLGLVFISITLIFFECQFYIQNFHYANAKNDAGAYNYGWVVDSANEIRPYLNEDVTAVGIGTSALFFELGIDRNSYRFDTTDMNDVWNGNQVFMWRGYENEYMPDSYCLKQEFSINGINFGIYEPV